MQAEQALTGPKIRQGTDAAPAQVTQPTEVGQERTHVLPFMLPSGCVVSPVVFRDPARVPPSSQFDLNGLLAVSLPRSETLIDSVSKSPCSRTCATELSYYPRY
jgi:hypothetical protein